MIIPMTKYTFLLLSADCDTFLSHLSSLGLVDIRRSTKPVDTESSVMLEKAEELRKRMQWLEKEDFAKDAEYAGICSRLDSERKSLRERKPWGEFNPEKLAGLEKYGLKAWFYSIDSSRFDENWAETCALEKISEENKTLRFVILSENEPDIPLKRQDAPLGSIDSYEERIAALEKALEERTLQLKKESAALGQLKKEYEDNLTSLDLYLAKASSEKAAAQSISVLTGFAPSECDAQLRKEFDGLDLYYIAEKAVKEDKPPIKLKNNSFSKQFEVFTGMYGMPAYDEFDPTVFLSIFYLLFFAICMGDAGYGILLMIIGMALKGRQGGLAKLYRLIITLGAGTFAVGLLMGTFFGLDLTKIEAIPKGIRNCMITGEIAGYSAQMVLSLGIGVVHISLAMIMKAVWSIRKSSLEDSLGTLRWTLLIVGSVIALALFLLGAVGENSLKLIIIAIAAVSALGIFLFNKRGRNPLLNIGSGLWDTYNMASGLMGDVLSYIRLYALGLSGGMLGSTFNSLGMMIRDGGVPVVNWLGFILILVIGHALNLALSCLGAFVHPLRLNFVEFFKNSGYEGSGNKYNPLGNNNKQ